MWRILAQSINVTAYLLNKQIRFNGLYSK